jgi:[acyl-carrier-protein] S-malonyltransferase
MAPAREGLAPLLAATLFRDPAVPVVTNVDAAPATSAAAARDALVRQVDSPVRWVESVEWMAGPGGMARCYELGPGKVLAGLVRRTVSGVFTLSVDAPDKIDKMAAGDGE